MSASWRLNQYSRRQNSLIMGLEPGTFAREADALPLHQSSNVLFTERTYSNTLESPYEARLNQSWF